MSFTKQSVSPGLHSGCNVSAGLYPPEGGAADTMKSPYPMMDRIMRRNDAMERVIYVCSIS